MPGPKPKPTALKLLQGNPGHQKLSRNEPKPRPIRPTCPRFLNRSARNTWERLVDELEQTGVLTIVDDSVLAGYCRAYELAQRLSRDLDSNGLTHTTASGYLQQRPEVAICNKAWDQVLRFGAELGIGAASRSRISIEKPNEGETPLAGILEANRRRRTE